MSATLTWRPKNGGDDLPGELKFALQEAEWVFPATIYKDSHDHALVKGLAAANVKGASDLLLAVEQHGSVVLELCW